MTLSVRLDEKTKTRLRRFLAQTGGSLSDFARAAILEKLEREAKRPTPYELGKHLFGSFDSGRGDLSTNSEKILREKLRAKHRR